MTAALASHTLSSPADCKTPAQHVRRQSATPHSACADRVPPLPCRPRQPLRRATQQKPPSCSPRGPSSPRRTCGTYSKRSL
eukprot:96681-Chlamydomonas_euryale.AAC.1